MGSLEDVEVGAANADCFDVDRNEAAIGGRPGAADPLQPARLPADYRLASPPPDFPANCRGSALLIALSSALVLLQLFRFRVRTVHPLSSANVC